MHLEYTLQIGMQTSLRSTYLYSSGTPTPHGQNAILQQKRVARLPKSRTFYKPNVALNNNNLLHKQGYGIYVFQIEMPGFSQKWTFWASIGISGIWESLTKSHSRPSICSLGSRHDVHQTVELSQTRWLIPLKGIS